MIASRPRLGVLGGMGPLATVDFLDKLIALTPARRDQDHLPTVMVSIPQVPDRSASILAGDDAPLPYLLDGIDHLNRLGVAAICVTCNTAHHWFATLATHSQAPLLHIADACMVALADCPPGCRVAVLATRGTLASGFYQQRLRDTGLEPVVPIDAGCQDEVDACIALVKSHRLAPASALCQKVIDTCVTLGCAAVILACTEIPIARRGIHVPHTMKIIDSNEELARLGIARLQETPQ